MSWTMKIYKYTNVIAMALLMTAYFLYQTYDMAGSIERAILEVSMWINIIFSTVIQVLAVNLGYDKAEEKGLDSETFISAEKLNNGIIKSVNNELDDFRVFAKKMNENEKAVIISDFLFSIGDKTIDELSKKELRQLKRLKPLVHDIYGFNLPLYYETTRNGKITYKASIKKNESKFFFQLQKMLMGVLFGAMTVNVSFSWSNLGQAFLNMLIVGGGVVVSYFMVFTPQYRKYTHTIPMKVMRKNTLYNSYIDYKNGTHILKSLDEVIPQKVVEEVVKEVNITKPEEIMG